MTVLTLSPVLGSPWATFLEGLQSPLSTACLAITGGVTAAAQRVQVQEQTAHLLNRGGRRESAINLTEV